LLIRHRVAVLLLLACLIAKVATPDDRRLLLVLDDFIDSEGTVADTNGSRFGVGNFSFASPALPAFPNAAGDVAVIGSVIPSHAYPALGPSPSYSSSWAIWNGSLKAHKLDNNGNIPISRATATPVRDPGTPTPVAGPSSGFPDESKPDDADPTRRRPVWNAARVLGYTDPVATLTGAAASSNPIGAISVWPGRKMVWGDAPLAGQPTVPLSRQDFSVPSTNDPPGTCGTSDNCFDDLITAMGLNKNLASDRIKAVRVVEFLRGGKSAGAAGSRDEILNELGTYGTVTPGSRYSYIYQDDRPGGNGPEADTPAYSHKLGDVFHSEPKVLLPPKHFPYLSSSLPRTGPCGNLTDCSYSTFARYHRYRRKTVFVETNDGFLHNFDAGVWDRDRNFAQAFDLGTGQEIFAYAPRSVMKLKFPNLLRFPPEVQDFTDGTPAFGDVFIAPTNPGGAPVPGDRTWKTVLVSGVRQGGHSYFALDVTQPDQVRTNVPTTDVRYGAKLKDKTTSPDCLDGDSNCVAPYPTILWELTDDCAIDGATCVTNMGETWSRPVVGRIKVLNGGSTEDRYVAILGGGFDTGFTPGTEVTATEKSSGRAVYIVDVERGKVIYKATSGQDSSGNMVRFAPMPAPPAIADADDDGYLDVAYIGDLNGRIWKIDLRPDSDAHRGVCSGCGGASETVTGYQPFLLYDGTTLDGTVASTQPIQPIFVEASIIFIEGGPKPTLGVAFGTGYRAELIQPNLRIHNGSQVPFVNRFHFIIDPGGVLPRTLHEDDLINVTPSDGIEPGEGPQNAENTPNGYFLNFGSYDEKAVSTVFATQGVLTLVTFSPSQGDPCTNTGESFRYRFSFLTGQGAATGVLSPFGTDGAMSQYREDLGPGLVRGMRSQSPNGTMIDTLQFPHGSLLQQDTGFLKTNTENWKEQ
jgi:PilC-like protein with beta-propeller domain